MAVTMPSLPTAHLPTSQVEKPFTNGQHWLGDGAGKWEPIVRVKASALEVATHPTQGRRYAESL